MESERINKVHKYKFKKFTEKNSGIFKSIFINNFKDDQNVIKKNITSGYFGARIKQNKKINQFFLTDSVFRYCNEYIKDLKMQK